MGSSPIQFEILILIIDVVKHMQCEGCWVYDEIGVVKYGVVVLLSEIPPKLIT